MKSRLLASLSLLALLAAPALPAFAQPIVLGAEDGAGPWGQADGRGCGNDLVRAAFKAAGVELRLSILPYVRAKEEALKGNIAGCFGMSWYEAFAGKIVFSRLPLYVVSVAVFRNKTAPLRAGRASELAGPLVLGTVRDYEYPAWVEELAAKGIRFEAGNSEAQNLKKLAAGRLDAVLAMVDELKSPDYLLRQAGVAGSVELAFVAEGQPTFVGFSLLNPQGLAAKAAFDKGMELIVKDGSYDRILAEWKARLRDGS